MAATATVYELTIVPDISDWKVGRDIRHLRRFVRRLHKHQDRLDDVLDDRLRAELAEATYLLQEIHMTVGLRKPAPGKKLLKRMPQKDTP